jgi:nitroreductase
MENNMISRKELSDAILVSQKTQRNWDLNKTIPEEDIKTIVDAATQCPSKQNFAFYKTHVITNREIIEQLHEASTGLGYWDSEVGARVETTNSQVLANCVLAFEEVEPSGALGSKLLERDDGSVEVFQRDKNMAVGIAAGYVNIVATLMGYSTGCCACYEHTKIKEILKMKGNPILLMGVGYKDENRQRREHHISGVKIPRRPKETIKVEYIK